MVDPAVPPALTGVTAMDTRVAEVTDKLALPETPLLAAVTVAVPAARALARPWLPALLLMVAVAVFDELQVTLVVRSWVEVSENVPMALNCCVVPMAALGPAGVTTIDCNVAAVTTNGTAEALTAPKLAPMLKVPGVCAVARP